uniref:GIY-YIG nuclease family protein n=1 Tax=uncultured Tenacibaculum sp. TaxID=174713 RepID=UPI002639EAEB|nr:GIY-YIG nuclease family protein [uncultured Tenacibaculum sp.]
MKRKLIIYTLELEGGFYYVGRTFSLKNRLKKHFKNKGSAWTKLHPPINLIKIEEYDISYDYEADYYENQATINLMKIKGWKKVRGGFWSHTNEYDTLKSLHHHNYFKEIKIDKTTFEEISITIYVLGLEENNFFIGYSSNPKIALKKHLNGKASKWTRMYKPLRVIETRMYKSKNGKMDISYLDKIVFEYGKKYSPEKVRGGSFVILDNEEHIRNYVRRINL